MIRFLSKLNKKWVVAGLALLVLLIAWQITSKVLANKLQAAYQKLESQAIVDRNGKLINISPNNKGFYDQFAAQVPPEFKRLLLKKEDRFFYYHPGINPASLARDVYSWIIAGKRKGSSTLTQQLVKTLLANENQRTWSNKLKEFFYTESLEWQYSKQQILVMYINSAYFGNLSQGLKQASLDNFNQPAETLSQAQTISLLASLSSPSTQLPGTGQNITAAKNLAQQFKLNIDPQDWENVKLAATNPNLRQNQTNFELNTLNLNCATNCQLTLDSVLTENLRSILKRNLTQPGLDTAANGAIVVIKLPENELVSMVGSPKPDSQGFGMQLNMATKPRPIGSTAKPFIYLNAFQKGARPYTLVDDSEIKYQIATGFDFYPKNFDGQYRGLVTLHQALDNSLNIPSVQVLDFVGLENFYKFLRNDLGFHSQQPLENYELGIALGGLESDLTTLSYYFTLFPQEGALKPLTLYPEF